MTVQVGLTASRHNVDVAAEDVGLRELRDLLAHLEQLRVDRELLEWRDLVSALDGLIRTNCHLCLPCPRLRGSICPRRPMSRLHHGCGRPAAVLTSRARARRWTMKLLYFDDYKVGVLRGERVIDVSP